MKPSKTRFRPPTFKSNEHEESEISLVQFALFGLFFVFVLVTVSRAGAASESQSGAVNAPLKPFNWSLSGSLGASISSGINLADPFAPSASADLSLGAQHRPSKVNLSARLSGSRELRYERDDGSSGQIDNIRLGAARGLWASSSSEAVVQALRGSVSATLPANREAGRQTFRGSLGLSVTAASMTWKTLSARLSSGYTYRNYSYDIRDNGVVNSPHAVRAGFDIDSQISSNLRAYFSLGVTTVRSFQGVLRSTSASDIGFDYGFLEDWTASLGLSTERGTLEPDGVTNRVRVLTPDSSVAYLSFTRRFSEKKE
jgi:hypothetical protein